MDGGTLIEESLLSQRGGLELIPVSTHKVERMIEASILGMDNANE